MDKELSNTNQNTEINDFNSLYSNATRLVMALFLVSKIMDEKSILRTKIEIKGLDILSISATISSGRENSPSDSLLYKLESNIIEVIGLLDVSSVAGLISNMNAGILKVELTKFNTYLDEYVKLKNESKVKSVRSLLVDRSTFKVRAPQVSNLFTSHISDTIEPDKGHNRKDTRKALILEFISKHNNVSIKDIIPNIRGCSEKTIQRELSSLIEERKISKVGERRWSRYSIVV